MFKRICLSVFLSIATIQPHISWSKGGDIVSNGGGLAEQNFAYAWVLLPQLIENCLKVPSCPESAQQRQALNVYSNDLRSFGASPLVFASEPQNPSVIRTSPPVGSSITINLDLIYTSNTQGELEPASLREAVGLLVSAIAIQHVPNFVDPDGVDDVLGELAERGLETLDLRAYGRPELRILNWTTEAGSSIWFDDSSPLLPINSTLADLKICTQFESAWTTTSVRVSDMRWASAPSWNPEQNHSAIRAQTKISVTCQTPTGSKVIKGILSLQFGLEVFSSSNERVTDSGQEWTSRKDYRVRIAPASLKLRTADLHEAR